MKAVCRHIIVVWTALVCTGLYAQDLHFTQFDHAPLMINPGLTGAFHGNQRVYLHYRDQWRSIGAPYRTFALSLDGQLMKKKWEHAYLGGGLTAFRDEAGDLSMGMTQFNLYLSGIVFLNDRQHLSLGLTGGYGQRSMDFSKGQWASQFDGKVYDSSLPANENFSSEAFGYPDFSAGLSWNYGSDAATLSSNDHIRARAGVSLLHANRPHILYYANGETISPRLLVHGRLYYGLNNSVASLIPSFFIQKQGPDAEIVLGTMFRYMLKEESKHTGYIKETALLAGLYYRAGDALAPAVTLELANFALGMSYDFNLSPLRIATNARGGMEISLRFINPNPFKAGEGSKSHVRFM